MLYISLYIFSVPFTLIQLVLHLQQVEEERKAAWCRVKAQGAGKSTTEGCEGAGKCLFSCTNACEEAGKPQLFSLSRERQGVVNGGGARKA